MKTAMQELIDTYYSIDKFTDFDTWIANNEKRLIEKEKEQIKDAFVGCWILNIPDGTECKLSAKEYFDLTYNQNK